ncbi:MAG: hypothetical protein ACRYF2_19115 [Janthinobacterium lividum]
MADFVGTWRTKRIVGASQGGLTGEDPKVIVGKVVRWTATDIEFPDGACRLRQPAVTLLPNRVLETRLWLGQQLNNLSLSKAEIARGFGVEDTPVFQDESGCASAVLIGRNHMVEMFGNGWIYWLERVPSYPQGIRHTFAGCARCARR